MHLSPWIVWPALGLIVMLAAALIAVVTALRSFMRDIARIVIAYQHLAEWSLESLETVQGFYVGDRGAAPEFDVRRMVERQLERQASMFPRRPGPRFDPYEWLL